MRRSPRRWRSIGPGLQDRGAVVEGDVEPAVQLHDAVDGGADVARRPGRRTASAVPPAARTSSTTASSASTPRAASTTVAPSPANRRAAAAPMPRPAPVMKRDLAGQQADGCEAGVSATCTPVSAGPRAASRHRLYLAEGRRAILGPWTGESSGLPAQPARADRRTTSGSRGPAAPHPGAAPRGGRAAGVHLHRVLHPAGTGPRPRPSREVLAGLGARAAPDRRRARPPPPPRRQRRQPRAPHPREVRPSILDLLDRLPQAAGIVMSADYEVLAWNDLAAALMEDFAALPPRRPQPRAPRLPRADHEDGGCTGCPTRTSSRTTSSRPARHRRPLPRRSRGDRARRRTPRRQRGVRPAVGPPRRARRAQLSKTFRHPVVGPVAVNCDFSPSPTATSRS